MAFNKDSVGGTLIAAFILCVVCGVVVSTAAVSLRPAQEANRLLDRQINVLRAADLYRPGVDVAEEFAKIDRRFVDLATGEEVERPDSYDQRKATSDPAQSRALTAEEDIAGIRRLPQVAEVFLVRDENGELSKLVLPISGYGLWSTMRGFIALESDLNTVAGLVFFEHGETPGLGGEIDNPAWQARWEGKRLLNDDGDVAIHVIKGRVDDNASGSEYRVDGLSGATLTSNGVTHMVRFWAGENGFGPYLERLRQSGGVALAEENTNG